jgi:hypothetical protein
MGTVVRSLSLCLLLVLAAAASAASARDDCSLTVTPRSGEPGTQFAIRGEGFYTNRIRLSRAGGTPRTMPVTSERDSFVVRLVADEPDAGRWRVSAKGCRETASLSVTLPPTATVAAEPARAEDRTPAIAAFAALGGLFLVSSILLVRRGTRPGTSR